MKYFALLILSLSTLLTGCSSMFMPNQLTMWERRDRDTPPGMAKRLRVKDYIVFTGKLAEPEPEICSAVSKETGKTIVWSCPTAKAE